MYLFIEQLVKLVKWMNYNQDIGAAKFDARDMENDDFLFNMNDIIV